MSALARAADLLKKAVTELENAKPENNQAQQNYPEQAEKPNVGATIRNLFAPYNTTFRRQPKLPRYTAKTTWTHKFCCIRSPNENEVPDKLTRRILIEAGLGEKKLVLQKNKDAEYLRDILFDHYPKLKEAGGFELMRSSSRTVLEVITMPSVGYTTQYLADESGLGSAVCFIRPLQAELSLESVNISEPSEFCPREICKVCGEDIPIVCLRSHLSVCNKQYDEDILVKRQKIPEPCFDAACRQDCVEENTCPSECSNLALEKCPICLETFLKSNVEKHAASCGESNSDANTGLSISSLGEALKKCEKNILTDDQWDIAVIRKKFLTTAMEQIEEATDADWEREIKVAFIGEAGLDAGGLTREFFSLLFQSTPIFENGSFSLITDSLEKKHYFLIGKTVSRSILFGHPGPICLNPYIVNFILNGLEPTSTELTIEQLSHREDITSMINKVGRATTEIERNEVFLEIADTLEMVGFRNKLTDINIAKAKEALLKHFLFYKYLPAILQFMEGLKLHGVLGALQQFPDEGASFLVNSKGTKASDLLQFFLPIYSQNQKEKEVEDTLMYNFHQLAKKIDRGNLKTIWINCESEEPEDVEITVKMSHFVQALIGCPTLPRNIDNGLIHFDHNSSKLIYVNTCAPSITISNCKFNCDYSKFEESFLNIIVGAPGFDIE